MNYIVLLERSQIVTVTKEVIEWMKEIISSYEEPKFITKEYFESNGINKKALSEVGSTITFTLNNGEKVEAMVVDFYEYENIALLMHVDCLNNAYPMNKSATTDGGYTNSYLRKVLKEEIFDLYPDALKGMMVPFMDDECRGDCLRLPTKEEIFGDDNGCGQLGLMKNRRNRIALRNNNPEWYWLQDVVSSTHFANVNNYGNAHNYTATNSNGVRPLFQISLI